MSNGSNSAAKLFAAADQVRPGQTAEHRSSLANLVQKKKTQIAPAAQHQKALGSTTTSAQDFAEKYAIASDNVVAAILNDANIKVEAGFEVDKSEQFMDWLRCIETDDERCIQFLVKVFDGSGEKDGVVSTEDLQAVLAGAEPSVASNLIADVMKGGVQFLVDEEFRNKAHAELEQEQADKERRLSHLNGIDKLTQRSTNATPDPPPDTVNKFKECAEALIAKRRQRLDEVHEDGIADHFFVKLLKREPNVAASVRDSIRKTFHQTVGYVPGSPAARAAANPDPSTANAANVHHGHSPHIAVDVDTANPSSDHDHDHEKRHHHGYSHSTGEDASDVTTTTKTSCAMLWKKTTPLRSPGFVVWTLLIAAFVGRLFQWRKANGQATSDLAIAVAKGAGFAILLATCFIYMTKLPLFAWIRIFPSFWDNTSFHAHFGVGLFVFTVVHVAAHFSWQGVNAFTTRTDASTADVSSKYNLSAAWLTGTGLVMAAHPP
eukprot:gene20768-19079_t